MKLIKLKCDNCGAELELNPDHLQAYCQFCGSKLLIDMDNLSEVLKEKEKTKRVVETEEQITKRKEMELSNKREKEKADEKIEKTVMFLVLGVPVIGFVIITIIYMLLDYMQYIIIGLSIIIAVALGTYIYGKTRK